MSMEKEFMEIINVCSFSKNAYDNLKIFWQLQTEMERGALESFGLSCVVCDQTYTRKCDSVSRERRLLGT